MAIAKQSVVVEQAEPREGHLLSEIALFNPDGTPFTGGGGGGEPTPVTSDDITDASEVGKEVLTAANQADARAAIGAGTSNLVIGTTATTAKAGNAVQTAAQTTATAIAPGTGTNVQAILAELAARITALENA